MEESKMNKRFDEIYQTTNLKLEKMMDQFKKLQKHTKDFELIDSKLHGVSYYIYRNKLDEKYFDRYCEEEREMFDEFLDNNNMTIQPFRRTSSFYIRSNFNKYDLDLYDMKDDEYIFSTIGYGVANYVLSINDITDPMIALEYFEKTEDYDFSDEEDLNDFESTIEDELDEMEDSLREYAVLIREARKVYNYVKYVKDNQVELFKEFYNENIEEEVSDKIVMRVRTVSNFIKYKQDTCYKSEFYEYLEELRRVNDNLNIVLIWNYERDMSSIYEGYDVSVVLYDDYME